MNKCRVGAPNCVGRFPQLRDAFYKAAKEARNENGASWRPITFSELELFVARAEDQTHGKDLKFLDPVDPYFNNRKDDLRCDPCVGEEENEVISLVPFAFEGLRRDLVNRISLATGFRERIARHMIGLTSPGTAHLKLSNDDYELLLLQIEEELLGEGTINELVGYTPIEVAQILSFIERKDPSITAVSMNPVLLDQYARLYATSPKVLDSLSLFHNGTDHLEQGLGIEMGLTNVPGSSRRLPAVSLRGYRVQAEFGTGLNLAGSIVADAPYRIELHKNGDHRNNLHGEPPQLPCFTTTFYLRHPDTMVVGQVQEMRGSSLPEGTTVGLTAFSLIEKIADAMGIQRVLAYGPITNPTLLSYPGDTSIKRSLRANFTDPLNRLGWTATRNRRKQPLHFERQYKGR